MREYEPINFGLIGAGKRGTTLTRGMLATGLFKLKYVCDPIVKEEEYRQKVTGEYLYSNNYHEMLECKDIDLVVVATPNDTHHVIAVDALNAGKNLLLEKPMALSFEQAMDIYYAWKKAQTILQVGLVLRYNPLFQKCKKLIQTGAIGKVFSAWEMHGINYGNVSYHCWRGIRKYGGTLFFEKMTHDIDIIMWMLASTPDVAAAIHGMDYYGGNKDNSLTCTKCNERFICPDSYHMRSEFVESRKKCVFRKELDLPSNMNVIFEMKNSAKVSYNANFFASHGTREFRFIGTEGEIILSLNDKTINVYGRGNHEKCIYSIDFDASGLINSLESHGGEENMYNDLYLCIRESRKPFAGIEAGIISVLAAEMAERSADSKIFVKDREIYARHKSEVDTIFQNYIKNGYLSK